MAPSLTQTTTVAEEQPKQTYKVHLGQYKEIDAVFVDKAAEEGKTGEPPAKVRHARHRLLAALCLQHRQRLT